MNTVIEIIKEHTTYGHQIIKMAKSDIIRSHSGTILGWLWTVIKPSIRIFVYWFAFTIGLRGGKPINRISLFLMAYVRNGSLVLYECNVRRRNKKY